MSSRSLLSVIAEATPDQVASRWTVLAPSVGVYRDTPPVGSLLVPGSVAGVLQVLGRRVSLVVPDGVQGHVAHPRLVDFESPVAYRQPLFELVAGLEPNETAEVRVDADAAGAIQQHDVDGGIAVRSTTVGTFYGRPRPDAPPFVSEGQEVTRGTVLGLVEVMKVFNQVTYDEPTPGTIARVAVLDGDEVKPGRLLFVVSPHRGDTPDAGSPFPRG